MPTHALRELTNLAIDMFDAQSDTGDSSTFPFLPGFGDPVLDGALGAHRILLEAYDGPALTQAVEALASDPAMEIFLPHDGEADPMLSSSMGGQRQDFRSLVRSIVASAYRAMYFDSQEQTPANLVRHVIENYEALRKVARGEAIRVRIIHGIGGVILPAGSEVPTPWGVVKPAPTLSNPGFYAPNMLRPTTTSILLRDHATKFFVSRHEPPVIEPDMELISTQQRISELLPLAFALAVEEGKRCAPTLTFTTSLQPFGSGFGASWSGRLGQPWQQTTVSAHELAAIEEWARRLNARHVDNLTVTARRIVSAIAERTDRSDALVDAVMAWESLVGTKNETVFRVTAALSKLLQSDPTERRTLRRSLGGTYEVRSRVVHGEAVDDAKVTEEADKAIDIALSATRALYRRSPEWLTYTSNDRADRLILEE